MKHPFSRPWRQFRALILAGVLPGSLLLLAACGGGPPPPAAPPSFGPPTATAGPAPGRAAGKKVPTDHVRDKKGSLHKSGMKDPLPNCASCHGQDLRGGPGAPSCFACHEKNWH